MYGERFEVGSVPAHDGPVTDVRVCEFERLVYSSGDDGFVKVWDVRTGRCAREFHAHDDPCSQIALLGNDKFASAGVDGAVWVWSAASGERIEVARSIMRGQSGALKRLMLAM
mmetsp:Transcript_23898/g.94016  ORF Transcript_23898/g.94016 Transcript_23898/m.94016 type:complete len:113 (-) Transcript_23898:466-804(-)